jgi:hypothetical protein
LQKCRGFLFSKKKTNLFALFFKIKIQNFWIEFGFQCLSKISSWDARSTSFFLRKKKPTTWLWVFYFPKKTNLFALFFKRKIQNFWIEFGFQCLSRISFWDVRSASFFLRKKKPTAWLWVFYFPKKNKLICAFF